MMNVEIDGPHCLKSNSIERVAIITGGRKKLTLSIHSCGRASARLDNIPGIERDPGETTAVMAAAKDILQNESRKQGPILFEVETTIETMRYWLMHQGKELFAWEFSHSVDDSLLLKASVLIKS